MNISVYEEYEIALYFNETYAFRFYGAYAYYLIAFEDYSLDENCY